MSRSYRKGFQCAGDKSFKKIFNRRLRRSLKCKDIPSGSAYKKYNCSYDICDYRGSVSWESFKSWPTVYEEGKGWDPCNLGYFHDEKSARGFWKRTYVSK